MNGKNKCKILKEIRRRIAEENDIAYVTSECKHQGNCLGTCPKCEAEVRYLEQELDKRKKAGKAVAVAGIAAAMVVTASGCDLFANNKMGEMPLEGDAERITEPSTEVIVQGSIANADETTEETFLIGEMPYEAIPGRSELDGETEADVLTGDVAWPAP